MSGPDLRQALLRVLDALGETVHAEHDLPTTRHGALAYVLIERGATHLPRTRAVLVELTAARGALETPNANAPAPERPSVQPLLNRANVNAALAPYVEPPEAMPLFVHIARISAVRDADS